MSTGFKKFKSGIIFGISFKCLAFSLSLGLCVAAFLLLFSKLELISVSSPLLIIAPVTSSLVLFGVLFLLMRPSDKGVAKKIDDEFSFNEKIQTMIEFAESDGAVVELQRLDAEARLSSVSPKKLGMKRIWVSILSLSLSSCLLVGAFVVPAKADDPIDEPTIDEYERDWRIVRIGEIITRVENSFMIQGLKDKIIEELNSLISVIEGTDKEAIMKNAAVLAVLKISDALDKENSAPEFSSAFSKAENSVIKDIASAIADLSGTAFKKALSPLKSEIESDAGIVNDFRDEFDAAIRLSGVANNDAFYIVLKDFSNKLASFADTEDDSILGSAFSDAYTAASAALLQQKDNKTTAEYAMRELIDIFGLTDSDLTDNGEKPPIDTDFGDSYAPPEDEEDEEDSGLNEGGYGSGEILFGSDDIIYDPNTDSYRKYGDVILEAYNKFDEQSSNLPKDVEEKIREYFAELMRPKTETTD